MIHPANLHPTVEEVKAEAAEGPPAPLIECSAEEARDVWAAEPETALRESHIDGWQGPEEDSAG